MADAPRDELQDVLDRIARRVLRERIEAHRADALNAFHVDGPAWYARCSCGWRGEDRPTRRAADDDAAAHEISEIEGRRS